MAQNSNCSVPSPNVTTQSSPTTQSQIIRPPSSNEWATTEQGTKPTAKVTRQSPPMTETMSSGGTSQFVGLKPESKDEMFHRIDTNRDNEITLDDYMKRDRFYVESVRTEFNDIDTNRDAKVTKAEFDAFVRRLEDQRKTAMLEASKLTLQATKIKNDGNRDGELSVDELGTYINGTLQRSVAQLPEVFRQFDRNSNQKLSLDEFHELDFNFPWEKFPPSGQMLFNGEGAQPPPFVAEQSAPLPPQLMQQAGRVGLGPHSASSIMAPPHPQPVFY
uniref:EF-hand domain-containing protein n=1 Tax=Globodera pallida TaxID=36090 RepID=A0A183C708_GLOPA